MLLMLKNRICLCIRKILSSKANMFITSSSIGVRVGVCLVKVVILHQDGCLCCSSSQKIKLRNNFEIIPQKRANDFRTTFGRTCTGTTNTTGTSSPITTTTRVRKGCCSKLNRGLCKNRQVLAQHLSILCHAGLHLASNLLNHQTTFTTKKSNLTAKLFIIFIIFIKSSTYSRTMGNNIMRNAPIVRYALLALMLLADLASGRLTGRNLDEGSTLNSTSWKWNCAITAPNVKHNVTSCESPCEVNAIETNGHPSCIFSNNTDTCTQIYNPISSRQLMGQNYNEMDMFCVNSATDKFDLTGFDVVNEEIINQTDLEIINQSCEDHCVGKSSCQGVRFISATGMCIMYTPIVYITSSGAENNASSSSSVEQDDEPSSIPSIRTIQTTKSPTTEPSIFCPPCPRKNNNHYCPFEKDMRISFRGNKKFENSKPASNKFVTTIDDVSYIQIKYRSRGNSAEYIRKRGGEDKCCSYIKNKVAKACKQSLRKIENTYR